MSVKSSLIGTSAAGEGVPWMVKLGCWLVGCSTMIGFTGWRLLNTYEVCVRGFTGSGLLVGDGGL